MSEVEQFFYRSAKFMGFHQAKWENLSSENQKTFVDAIRFIIIAIEKSEKKDTNA